MDWINIHISALDSAAFVRANPVQRGTWLCLLRFCIGQENGGRILECSTWGDSTWQQMARVKLKEVRDETELWYWEEFNLVVNHYPKKQEKIFKQNKKDGLKGGRPKKMRNNPPVTPPVMKSETPRVPTPHNVKEEEEERNSKEKESKVSAPRKSGQPTTDSISSPDSPSLPWGDENTALMKSLMETWSQPGARMVDVWRYFGLSMDMQGKPLEGEWSRVCHGLSPAEVALILFGSPRGSIQLPSHFRVARKAYQFDEKATA